MTSSIACSKKSTLGPACSFWTFYMVPLGSFRPHVCILHKDDLKGASRCEPPEYVWAFSSLGRDSQLCWAEPLTVRVCAPQTPAGDAGTLLSSGRILWRQERGAPCRPRKGWQPATRLLAAFHPPLHVPRDEGEAGHSLISGDSHGRLVFRW